MNVEELITTRINERCKNIPFKALGIEECYIAGNSCNRDKPNDYDLFPVSENDFDGIEETIYVCEKEGILTLVMETKNAITIKTNEGVVIQLCKYFHPSLEDLVDSFDFAHTQIGAKLELKPWGMSVEDLYYTDDWETAHLLESTFYTGSKYPLSSLMRAFKYYKRGDFSGNSIIYQVLIMVLGIVKRGVEDYDDFKDQLDAVDLAMVPDKFTGEEGDSLMELFVNLREMPVTIREYGEK